MDDSGEYSSLENFISNKLMNFVREIIESRSITPIIFSEIEINDLIELINKSVEDNSSASKSSIKVEIINGKILLHVSNSVFKLIPLNFTVESIAGIKSNNVVLCVDRIKSGFLRIPISSGLKSFKEISSQYITIDEENKCIVLNNPLPQNIKLKSININEKNLELYIGVSIKSKEDLFKIAEIFPEDIKQQIKASGIEKLADVGKSILSGAANFIKKQKDGEMK